MLRIKPFYTVTGLSFLIAILLIISAWQINIWPTDAEVYYMPAAQKLSSLHYLSEINHSLDEERIKWLHGKELHVLAIWAFQQLLGDSETLRPLMLLGALSICISSILIFLISSRIWSTTVGLILWFIFSFSFWPYLYVLFAKHQTQGLCFFLASLTVMLYARHSLWLIFAGILMGISFFSSTVSVLYLPYMGAAFWYLRKNLIPYSLLFSAGFGTVLIWVNYPDIINNIRSYLDYVQISSSYNHFFYNQTVLVQWLPYFNLQNTRGGWLWIIQYFFLVMPIVFPLYLLSVIWLLRQKFNWTILALITLSFSSPFLAEIKQVAQYGANYFTSFVGILFLIGVTANQMIKEGSWKKYRLILISAAVLHCTINLFIFVSDIYPARLATTFISKKIEELNSNQLFSFIRHPLRPNIVEHLNPSTLNHLEFIPIDSIMQPSSGFILLPPPSTDSIYRASNGDYTIFDDDLVLNQMIRQGKLKDYSVASFKTLSSSLIWSQEEEILAYRNLALHQFKGGDLSRAWILDASLIHRDRSLFMPTEEDLFLFKNKIRNIGTSTKMLMYKGYTGQINQNQSISSIAMRIFKVGDPKDSLVAYLFKVDDQQPTWVPYSKSFSTIPVPSSQISHDMAQGIVVFNFQEPIDLIPDRFFIAVYRTGKDNDQNYYRIWEDFIKFK